MEKEVLTALYDSIKERETTEEYDNLRERYREIKKRFSKGFEEEKQEELEQLTETLVKLNDIESKEDFCEGFSMAVRLFVECMI